MDTKVLNNLIRILKYKIDHLEYDMSLAQSQLSECYDTIAGLCEMQSRSEKDIKFDSSARWVSDYKERLRKELNNQIHRYAEQKNNINELKLLLLRENQKKDAVSKICEHLRSEREKTIINREEEDVEELCTSKQFL